MMKIFLLAQVVVVSSLALTSLAFTPPFTKGWQDMALKTTPSPSTVSVVTVSCITSDYDRYSNIKLKYRPSSCPNDFVVDRDTPNGEAASQYRTSTRNHPHSVAVSSGHVWEQHDAPRDVLQPPLIDRRKSMQQILVAASIMPSWLVPAANNGQVAAAAAADSTISEASQVYERKDSKQNFGYQLRPPSDCNAGNKPLKTHLDEVNFISTSTSGYQYGVTVDPVRITSLKEFGTPEQVAAKVVLAEVNRDGVFDVKLMEDPMSGTVDTATTTGIDYYLLNYRSTGKRGIKRYIAKFLIQNQKLYALTAQCKEDDFPRLEEEILDAVNSFQTL